MQLGVVLYNYSLQLQLVSPAYSLVLLAGCCGWFVLREKYCWLVTDKPNEHGVSRQMPEGRGHGIDSQWPHFFSCYCALLHVTCGAVRARAWTAMAVF
jgi:hypothetical protein